MCAAITSEVTCQLNQDLCEWNAGQCVPTTGKDFDMRKHIGVIVVSAALSFTAVVFLCCALACACLACRRVVQRRRTIKRLPTRRPKKNGFMPVPQHDEFELRMPETTAVNVVPAIPAVPEAQHPYPFQPYVMMQAADGTLVPVAVPFPPHSYSHPMVQVIPGYHVQQPATQ